LIIILLLAPIGEIVSNCIHRRLHQIAHLNFQNVPVRCKILDHRELKEAVRTPARVSSNYDRYRKN